jgi:hypothetical protein
MWRMDPNSFQYSTNTGASPFWLVLALIQARQTGKGIGPTPPRGGARVRWERGTLCP